MPTATTERYELMHVDLARASETLVSSHETPDLARQSARERADGRTYIVRDAGDNRANVGDMIYSDPGNITSTPTAEPDDAGKIDMPYPATPAA